MRPSSIVWFGCHDTSSYRHPAHGAIGSYHRAIGPYHPAKILSSSCSASRPCHHPSAHSILTSAGVILASSRHHPAQPVYPVIILLSQHFISALAQRIWVIF